MEVDPIDENVAKPDVDSILKATSQAPLKLTKTESLILDLWDQEQELQLERSLLEADPPILPPSSLSVSDDDIKEQLTVAEQEMLDARARYMLRQTIIRNVILVDPILKAVHGGLHSNSLEERLLPFIHERDVMAMLHSTIATSVASTRLELSKIDRENLVVNQKNQQLAQAVLGMVEQLKEQTIEEVDDEDLRTGLEAAEREEKLSKRRMRVMKGIASGVVVGSGVEWAKEARLLELVMDDEE